MEREAMNAYETANIERLRKDIAGCTVLLRKNGRFPLDGPCRIVAYGAGVRYTVKGGTGSGEVNSRYFVTVEEGLREAGFNVVTNAWSSMYATFAERARKRFHDDIRTRAKKEKMNVISASMGAVMKQPEYLIPLDLGCDAAIYVVSRISGEGNDRLPEKGDLMLTDSEVRDILALDSAYDRFMLVINAGGPVDLTPVKDVGNILVLSQLGVETGSVLADILLGRAYPSGKLATTWAAHDAYCGAGDFGQRDDTRYREGIYVGYRFFDTFGEEPLFPFGYGLGFTDFRAGKGKVRVSGSEVTVSVRVRNTGSYPGREVAQTYVACPSGRLDREAKSLAAFAKTDEIAPGSSRTVRMTFDIRDLAAYDTEGGRWLLEKGSYVVLTGTSSRDVKPAAVLVLEEDFVVRTSVALFDKPGFEDIRSTGDADIDTAGLPVIRLDLSGMDALSAGGSGNGATRANDPLLSGLSREDLAYLNVGYFSGGGIASVIGDASSTVPGAAGETTHRLRGRGIPAIVMADGPAGIRVAKQYYEDAKGKHALGSVLPESMAEMLPGPVRKLLSGNPRAARKAVIRQQYCTALPIGTAIAQSFDTDFAGICGDIVGSEMDIFGIDLWLAPALNIHRSVLCGRNFEYFSEDPLVSGKMAAAITRGVQAHKGRGVTIKHYAANNQETNRYASNSLVSERALREIYLRGFGICIRESDPMAIMTSYNLLNGQHTSESRALTDIARGEFGFDGIIMTDWVIGGDLLLVRGSSYGTPDQALVAAAGCSLFMPGGMKDVKEITKGLSDGRVSEGQLRENAGWLLHVMSRLGLL